MRGGSGEGGERAGVPAAAIGPTLLGWTALALASLTAAWIVTPLLRPAGPDLARLPPVVSLAAPPEPSGGSGARAPAAHRPSSEAPPSPAGRLDLNRASQEELASLPGIGPVLAERIVAHRRAVGGFPHVEAFRGVPGIGARRYERLAPFLRVAGEEKGPEDAEDGL